MSRVTVLLVAVLLATGCARAAETSLQDAVDGVAGPERYVRAVVTDVRSTDEMLVELSSGDVNIWVTGFDDRPGRGSEVWTAVLGAPEDNEFVGLTYPTAGALEAPDVGITEVGALAVLLGLLAVLGTFFATVSAGILRMRPGRRCPTCKGRCGEDWITCASCGQVLSSPAAVPPAPATATVFSARQEAPVEPPAPEPVGPSAEPDADAPSRGTRIVRRDA